MAARASYEVVELSAARAQLEALPIALANRVRRKAAELAELAAVAPVSSSVRSSRFPSTGHFGVSGLRVTYAVDALRQRLTLQSVVRELSRVGS